MQVHLTVTQLHIDNGSICDSGCPIALALDDQVPDCLDVSVIDRVIAFRDPRGTYRCRPDDQVVGWIHDFDESRPVEPFELDLDFDFEPADPTA